VALFGEVSLTRCPGIFEKGMRIYSIISTPSKFNIVPEKRPSQKESSFPTITFAGAIVNFADGTNRKITGFRQNHN